MLLYHATYRPYLHSIKKGGLSIAKTGANYEWDRDAPPCICFTDDPELSWSYADTGLDEFSDDKYDKFEGTIVILVVNTDYLNRNYLINGDKHICDESVVHYWTYFSDISPNLIGIMNFKTNKIDNLVNVKRFTDKYICHW